MNKKYWILDMCPQYQNMINNTKNFTIVTEKIEFSWQEHHQELPGLWYTVQSREYTNWAGQEHYFLEIVIQTLN